MERMSCKRCAPTVFRVQNRSFRCKKRGASLRFSPKRRSLWRTRPQRGSRSRTRRCESPNYLAAAVESQTAVESQQAALSTATESTTIVSLISTTAVVSVLFELAAPLPQATKPAAKAATQANWKNFFMTSMCVSDVKTGAKVYLFLKNDTAKRNFL